MGTTVKAELSYGYQLKGREGEWFVREIHSEDSDEYGLNVDWLDAEDEDDFVGVATARLLVSVGFTETDYAVEGFFDRKREALARLGVCFEHTGYEAGDLLLVTKQLGAYLGETEAVDPATLVAEVNEMVAERLRNALSVLGLTPLQEQPAWFLTAYMG